MRVYIALIVLLVLSSCYKPKNDILDAFEKVNESMKRLGTSMEDVNNKWLDKIDSAYAVNPSLKSKYYYNRLKADSIGTAFVTYIDSLKLIIENAVGRESDNISISKKILIDDGEGAALKAKINYTRDALLSLLDDEDKSIVKSDLFAKDDPQKAPITWESELFEHTPEAAVVTLFEKFKNDALITESQVLQAIYNEAVNKSN